MNRILFFTFFGYRDYILDIKLSFEKHGSLIYDLPYHQLKNDDNLSDQDIIAKCTDIILNESIDIVFMFLLPDVNGFINSIKANAKAKAKTCANCKPVKFIFYNFDDPKSINIDMERYSKGIDYFFTPCESSMSKLKCILKKENNLTHLPKYFKNIPREHATKLDNNETNYTENNADLQNKIGINCDNDNKTYDICILYSRKAEQFYDMKNIIKDIKLMTVDKSFTIKLLGDFTLEDEYQDIYEGRYSVLDVATKVSDSKVVLYIKDSILSDGHRDDILNILFESGSIVITPFTRGMGHVLRDEYNCVIFDKDTYLQKIFSCIINYGYYDFLGINAKKSVSINLNIDTWSGEILKTVS